MRSSPVLYNIRYLASHCRPKPSVFFTAITSLLSSCCLLPYGGSRSWLKQVCAMGSLENSNRNNVRQFKKFRNNSSITSSEACRVVKQRYSHAAQQIGPSLGIQHELTKIRTYHAHIQACNLVWILMLQLTINLDFAMRKHPHIEISSSDTLCAVCEIVFTLPQIVALHISRNTGYRERFPTSQDRMQQRCCQNEYELNGSNNSQHSASHKFLF